MSVLINGASGTGKEYVAHRIHQLSKRSEKPFIAIDCGSIPKDLAASEFFGHVKGSFTGALNDKAGAFEEANGGTLFWMKSGTSATKCRYNCCVPCKNVVSAELALQKKLRWMSVLSAPQTKI